MRTNGSYVIHEGTLVISEEFQIVKKCNEATEESNVPDAGRGVTKETILTEFPEAKPNDTDLVQSFSRELPDAKFTVEGEELTLTAKDFKETFTFTDKNHKKVRDQQGIEYDVS